MKDLNKLTGRELEAVGVEIQGHLAHRKQVAAEMREIPQDELVDYPTEEGLFQWVRDLATVELGVRERAKGFHSDK